MLLFVFLNLYLCICMIVFVFKVRTSAREEVEQLCDKFLSDDEVPEYFFDR